MAYYEMTKNDLARYLSDTEYRFAPQEAHSGVGVRVNGADSRYSIAIKEIAFPEIKVSVDTFVEASGNIQARVYIPQFSFVAKTDELSPAYEKGSSLGFSFFVPKTTLRLNIPVELSGPKSFDDFLAASEYIIDAIEGRLRSEINKFRPEKNNEWIFKDINAVIDFCIFPSVDREYSDYER